MILMCPFFRFRKVLKLLFLPSAAVKMKLVLDLLFFCMISQTFAQPPQKAVFGTAPPEERPIYCAFKNSMSLPPDWSCTGLNPNTEPCAWYGVHCASTGELARFEVAGYGIRGKEKGKS